MTGKRALVTGVTVAKAICWLGVVADAVWTIALLHPPLFGLLTGRPDYTQSLELRLTMGIGASLMAGWTLLLAWASYDPVARRGVLLLTACPVVLGLGVVAVVSILDNGSGVWILVKLVFLGSAMLVGFHLARTEDRRRSARA